MSRIGRKSDAIDMFLLLFLDVGCLLASYLIALYIRFQAVRSIDEPQLHWIVFLGVLIFTLLYNSAVDYNRNFTRRGYFVEFKAITKRNLIIAFGMGFVLFAVKEAANYSRLVYGYFLIINEVMTLLVHILAKKYARSRLKRERNKTKILVVTDKEHAKSLLEELFRRADYSWDIQSVALADQRSNESEIVICLNEEGKNTSSIHKGEIHVPIVAYEDNLLDVSTQMAIDEVFIMLPDASRKYVNNLIHNFEMMGAICHYSIDVTEMAGNNSTVEEFGGFTVITYAEMQVDYRRRMIKRFMDIIGALVGLVITGITFPFVAIAIKVNSKGPIFFAQTRIGKNGRRFKIYKYRSMYVDAEERKKELEAQNEAEGLMFKMKDDPRITKVGKFLRKTSIDELPQFYNILIGDMSLVGTRPPTEDEFEKYTPYYKRRLCMTPGLTGLWQVSGRSNIENFDDVVKYDLHYIDHWSLSLDFKILLQTVGVVLLGKGAK